MIPHARKVALKKQHLTQQAADVCLRTLEPTECQCGSNQCPERGIDFETPANQEASCINGLILLELMEQ